MKNSVFLWLFWACFIQLVLSINTHFASSICLDDERSLLLQLRRGLDYSRSNSIKLANWNQTLDCCQWSGVQCNSSTGHVIGLDLSGESITNSSDSLSSLLSLQFLQSLNLANNSFSNAEIPSGLGRLASLTYLNLSNAGFSGQVPIELSKLSKLVTLDLSSLSLLTQSHLKLERPNLAMLIKSFGNLRGLHLSGVMISAKGSEWCKALSSSVPNLQFLSLSNCNLSGEIDASLQKLLLLSEINLDQNNLASTVPEFIANFGNLTTLKLSYCQLKGTFPWKILMMPTLNVLDISYNGFLQGKWREFPLDSSLQTLVVSFTGFSGQLPNSIGNLMHLQRIELKNCSFNGSIPSSMKWLKQLVYVDFSNNNFSGPIPSFSLAKNLSHLLLSNNMLNGTLASTHWAHLSNLVNLDLTSNLLNGNIPGFLFSLPSLQSMQVCQNEFNGSLKEFNISSPIQILDLSFNTLEGPIPKSIFELQGLKVLKLPYNRLNGSVDLHLIQQLKKLSVIELSFNKLEVYAGNTSTNFSSFPQLRSLRLGLCNLHSLPKFLKWQYNLEVLDLSDNHIQGSIPRWIWEVNNLSYLNLSRNNFVKLEPYLQEQDPSSLRVLDLSSNKLQGEVPKPPSKVLYLDYSNNGFISIIPTNIGDFLEFTILFSLSGNHIHGDIPTSLCSPAYLQVLDLSHNQLDGAIPNCLIEMTSTLGVLNLGSNKLRGHIIDSFPESCSLRTLGVNANYLTGIIPRSLANCKQLQVLDLGKNIISDTFPRWLDNMLQLRVFVIRSNRFHGSIYCGDNDLNWPKLHIIDLAFNNFSGTLQEDCFLNLEEMTNQENLFNTKILQYDVYSFTYTDMVSVTLKGTEFLLRKILNLFSTIDFSSNSFNGEIPRVIGKLNGLQALNLSHNAFSGSIPSTIGNLSMLESLDLSQNNLNGSIPTQLVQLNFLESLNLSFNKLVGKIPEGSQFQTFDASSFLGNVGLCDSPLPKCPTPPIHSKTSPSPSPSHERISSPDGRFDWQSIFISSGFGTGAGLVIAPLFFCKKRRKWFDKRVNGLVSAIFLSCGIDCTTLDVVIQPEDGIGHQLFDFSSYHGDETDDETNMGQFCVFCTKLDIERKRVIHNSSCICHGPTASIWSSFSLSSSKRLMLG